MVRLLGEDLVLYKDRSGTYGLIEPLCAHRRINLLYGVPLQHGLRCPYHGWAYDETGACIEMTRLTGSAAIPSCSRIPWWWVRRRP
jgi:phenylpropionate dioxygenase-like ring-hydroxylating dioxygenase large terminal subunit